MISGMIAAILGAAFLGAPIAQVNVPDTFAGFLLLLVSDVVFLGIVAAGLTGIIINGLIKYANIDPSENARRLISVVVPIALVTLGQIAQVLFSYATLTPDTVYQAYVTALGAIVGKQVIYIGYKMVVSGGRTRAVTPQD